MKEYIDRESAIGRFEAYRAECEKDGDVIPMMVFMDCLEELRDIPKSDVVEVVHGKWKTIKYPGLYVIKCSACGIELDRFVNGASLPKHCFCGAKMDLEE